MSSELEKMGLDGFVSSSNNVDNEIEVLRSKSLAREVAHIYPTFAERFAAKKHAERIFGLFFIYLRVEFSPRRNNGNG